MKNDYKTWVEINKKALLSNAKIVRGLLGPEARLMAVVKSNAYGHGLVKTAKILTNPQLGSLASKLTSKLVWLGVDNIDEAISLRENGIKNPILVLGYTPPEQIKKAISYKLRFTVYDSDVLKKISSFQIPAFRFQIHLKIDTGMSRQGVLVSDLPKFLRNMPQGFKFEGVYTHFANADNLKDRSYPNFQFAEFKKALGILEARGINPETIHASATTGLLMMPEAHFDMVRAGIILYGLWPSSEFRNIFKNLKIKPVLSWKTRVVQVKKIRKNTPVGYGVTERVKRDTTIAVLPMGYYDGYLRVLSGKPLQKSEPRHRGGGEVLMGGKRCKILGRISMNMSVVDVSACRGVKVDNEAVLIGRQGQEEITVEELAEKAGTISYEIVSRINPLVLRIYI